MPKPIYVLNGPTLNLLGTREPHIYGSMTLDQIKDRCAEKAGAAGLEIDFRQSNHEGQLVDWIQDARINASALVLNPAAYGHTSIALYDVLKTLEIPIIECHLSNPGAREPFRHHSYVTPTARGVVTGFGPLSYDLAIEAAVQLIRNQPAAAPAKA